MKPWEVDPVEVWRTVMDAATAHWVASFARYEDSGFDRALLKETWEAARISLAAERDWERAGGVYA